MTPPDSSDQDSPAESNPANAAPAEFAERYFRSGLGLRRAVHADVEAEYRSDLIRRFREQGYTIVLQGITFRLAEEFGFCYGVERAVDYAYETVTRFPDRRIILTGEIIHNPDVNGRLQALGIQFLGGQEVPDVEALTPEDVVLVPAFGVAAPLFHRLRRTGAVVVDTTCGSVLNVWKNVERYARENRTSIVHGKVTHEETLATVSRVRLTPDAHYLVLLDMAEARQVASYIRGGCGALARAAFVEQFEAHYSEGFDPALHLDRVGMANQTTMLSGESLAIAQEIRSAFVDRYGELNAADRFRSFDTICSATQERQDALRRLIEEPLDLMLVIGGYNSSNTGHLLELSSPHVRAFHIKGPECLVDPHALRHKPEGEKEEVETRVEGGWLPDRELRIGLTAGASTPDVVIGAVVDRILEFRLRAQ